MLTIGNVNGGTVEAAFALSLVKTFREHPEWAYLPVSSPYVYANRNVVVETYLAEPRGGDWLLFIDSDIAWEPEQIEMLLDAADEETRPVMSGLYFHPLGTGQVANPVAWDRDGDPVSWRDGEVVEAGHFGFGFVLVHRRVLERIVSVFGYPFDTEYTADDFVTEDIVFCDRARAVCFDSFVHTGVIVSHTKPVALHPGMSGLVSETVRLRRG